MTAAESAAPANPRYRIALVDDEPNILSALRRELRELPFDLVVFDNPVAAQEALTGQEFGLVVSDNLMPNLTGLELLARIKEAQPRTRRILLTGRTDLNHAVEAFNAGAIHRFLNKPWNKTELLEAIHRELELYQTDVRESQSRTQLETQNKLRGERLITTIRELKQTQTQLVLLEDSTNMEALKAGHALRGLSFLIVDEHEAVRNLLLGALNGAGIARCHGEPNAHAALAYLKDASKVDVILAEWSLQGTDGIAMLRQLRQSESPSNRALFILMAANEQRQVVQFAMKSGIDDYLIKPFRLSALFASIDKLLALTDEAKAERLAALKAATILVANTHPASRDQIEELLHQAGVQNVVSATFGPAAMALLLEKKPAIVVYDINVKEPGWEEMRARFSAQPGSPALLVTGVLPSEADWAHLRKCGESNFLPGPFQQAELVAAIMSVWTSAK
jgi:DNA-binding NtrC family response regulator